MTTIAPRSPDGEPYSILVVEDEFLIAMELTNVLEDSGFRVLGPAPSVQAALELLSRSRPHAAVLDMNLNGEPAIPVARMLRHFDVPFAIASAYMRSNWPNDEALRDAVSLGKPTAAGALVRTLHELISDRR